MNASDFICAKCGAVLYFSEPQNVCRCVTCSSAIPVKYGIPDFSHDSQFYWGELEREAMERLLMSNSPTDQALEKELSERNADLAAYLKHYVLDPCRAGWKFLLNLPTDGRMLDFGCGWGGLALSLGPHFKEAWVTDIVPERVAVALKRSRELGYDHFKGCASSGWPHLPFKDGFFDLIVINGALEWIPSSIKGNPKQVQQAFLKEIARVLSPRGQLVLGIENRFGFSYFIGKPEEHTKLRFISLLPRFAGRLYHKTVLHSDYRCYTYGRYGLSRLLANAGLASMHFLCPYPDYREFNRVVDLDNPFQVVAGFAPKTRIGKIKNAVIRQTGVLKWIANSFLVMADKAQHNDTLCFFDRLLRYSSLQCENVSIVSYRMTPAGNVTVRFRRRLQAKDQLLTLPLGKKAATRLRMSIENRRQFRLLVNDALLPEFDSGEFEGVFYVCESYFDGVKISEVPALDVEAYGIAMLKKLHALEDSMKEFCPVDYFSEATVNQFLESCYQQNDAEKIAVERLYRKSWAVRTGLYHGDFHYGNILKDRASDALLLIDWDLAGINGLPLWDALNLYVHARFESGDKWAAGYRSVVRCLLDSSEGGWLAAYVKNQHFTQDEVLSSLLTYPLMQWRNKMQYGDGCGNLITCKLASAFRELLNWT